MSGMMHCLYAKCKFQCIGFELADMRLRYPCVTDCVMAELEKLGYMHGGGRRAGEDRCFRERTERLDSDYHRSSETGHYLTLRTPTSGSHRLALLKTPLNYAQWLLSSLVCACGPCLDLQVRHVEDSSSTFFPHAPAWSIAMVYHWQPVRFAERECSSSLHVMGEAPWEYVTVTLPSQVTFNAFV